LEFFTEDALVESFTGMRTKDLLFSIEATQTLSMITGRLQDIMKFAP